MEAQRISIPGLSRADAAARLKTFGPNELNLQRGNRAFFEFLGRFKNPLVGILVGAALLSGFFGDRLSAAIIIAIVFASTILDFINTHRSEQAAEALKKKVMITATVLRDGAPSEIPLREIVPGDIVLLHPGDFIPADGMIRRAEDFFVNESALTGESFPAEKATGAEISMGTSVLTGEATMEVLQTGKHTKFSRIAEAISAKPESTEFDRGIKDFSVLIMKITFALVALIFLINATLKHSVLESFLFAAALAVGFTPELLPMIIALNLSKGSLRMARHGVIVKKLSAIQDFGSMDIFCTDKTGTLTEDKISLVQYVDGLGQESQDVLRYSYVQSSLTTGFKNPLDSAILEFAKTDMSPFKKIDEIPFDYERRRDSVVVEENGKRILLTKGAPEELLAVSTYYKDKKLDPEMTEAISAEYRRLSEESFRVLGIAIKEIHDARTVYLRSDE